MQISPRLYFGVETLVRLVSRNAARPWTVQSLAGSIDCSMSFTEGLMAELRKAGLVETEQGPGGGFYLNRAADQITMAEVFRVFAAPHSFDAQLVTPLHQPQSDVDKLHGANLLWEALMDHVMLFLESVSLADLAPAADGASPEHVGPRFH